MYTFPCRGSLPTLSSSLLLSAILYYASHDGTVVSAPYLHDKMTGINLCMTTCLLFQCDETFCKCDAQHYACEKVRKIRKKDIYWKVRSAFCFCRSAFVQENSPFSSAAWSKNLFIPDICASQFCNKLSFCFNTASSRMFSCLKYVECSRQLSNLS